MKKSGLADSPFFRATPPPASHEQGHSPPPSERQVFSASTAPERKSERTEDRPEKRTAPLPLKRRTKRYSFEFYEDQIARLKQLKIQAEMAGESVTLSDMARAALEDYLKGRP